jgi:hypothetical protein
MFYRIRCSHSGVSETSNKIYLFHHAVFFCIFKFLTQNYTNKYKYEFETHILFVRVIFTSPSAGQNSMQ